MSSGKYYLLDTFCRELFQGNPTPVCILDEALRPEKMALLAQEFNAPVTAFVEPTKDEECSNIRYFTVEGEIPACGHATLGAGHVLLLHSSQETMEFRTIEGIKIEASRHEDRIFLKYPMYRWSDWTIPQELLDSLSIEHHENHLFCDELKSLFIQLKDPYQITKVSPDFKRLKASSNDLKEVVIMAPSLSNESDFVLRSFCPWIGIDEDPVTGSIHSVLGPYWKEKTGKDELQAYQASKRGGEIFINVLSNAVKIGGNSRILVEGTLRL